MSVLQVNNLEKSFGSVKVLKDISFTLEKGKALAIIGSSGSGKTTLLRCLNFLETADKGSFSVNSELLFNGNDKQAKSESEIRKKRLHFGLVFQSFNLFPQYTALENVMLAQQLLIKQNNENRDIRKTLLLNIEKHSANLLEQMGLSDKLNNYPHQLSGGQQQRVAIARALALNPDILCFDEPTSALDPELTGEVLKVIKALSEKHTTMIIVTHEMNFAKEVADDIIFMDDGLIVEKGNATDVIENPKQERTRQFLARIN